MVLLVPLVYQHPVMVVVVVVVVVVIMIVDTDLLDKQGNLDETEQEGWMGWTVKGVGGEVKLEQMSGRASLGAMVY